MFIVFWVILSGRQFNCIRNIRDRWFKMRMVLFFQRNVELDLSRTNCHEKTSLTGQIKFDRSNQA